MKARIIGDVIVDIARGPDGSAVDPATLFGPTLAAEFTDLPPDAPAQIGPQWRRGADGTWTAPPASPPPVATAFAIYKTDVVTRMTDDELTRFDAALTSAPVRTRRMWTDCVEIRSDSPFFATLQAQFTTAFGADRTAAILAQS